MIVTVHNTFHPWYYLYFIKGLAELNVQLRYAPLIDQSLEDRLAQGGFAKDYLILSVQKAGKERMIVIGADDKTDISADLYDLADLYGKTNTSVELMNSHGIVPLGPTFGVRYADGHILRMAAADVIRGDYDKWKLVLKRNPLESYYELRENSGEVDRIFYLNYPWKKHSGLTNFRLSIIQLLKKLEAKGDITFEGGFSKRRFGYHEGLKDLSANKLYSHKKYLQALVKSKVAINTPAVHSCLGWKLGEFLALGRCTLSFPISNVMPFEFKQGVHYHQVDELDGLEAELAYLTSNRTYVEGIQRNAKAYFDTYVRPVSVMGRLLDQLG
jgi:hypothetical protein